MSVDLEALRKEDKNSKPTYYLLALIAIAEQLKRIGDLLEKDDVSSTHEIDVDAIQKHIKNR